MTQKHTPGPLEVLKLKSNDCFEIVTEQSEHVAIVKNNADAVLYAAAPDLLEALKKVRLTIKNEINSVSAGERTASQLRDLLDEISGYGIDAISKAESQ